MNKNNITYEQLKNLQGGVCAICHGDEHSTTETLILDVTGLDRTVRGLICDTCEQAIQVVSAETTIEHNARLYLKRHDTAAQTWHRYFMDVAELIATRSKDMSTQVGCVIALDKRIISTGYNGLARGVCDNKIERHIRPAKYRHFVHAEENALMNAAYHGISTKDATLYVTPLTPCVRCARGIIQAGIKEVMYHQSTPNPRFAEDGAEGVQMLNEAGVILTEVVW